MAEQTQDTQAEGGGQAETTAAAKIAEGLAARGQAAPAAKEAERKPEPEKKPEPPPTGQEPSSAADIKALRDRLANLEAREDAVQQQREALDAQDSYIREKMDDLPRDICRKMLPATKDLAVLKREEQRIRDMFKSWLADEVKGGRLKSVDLGGASKDGGLPPGALSQGRPTAADLIAQGLQQRQR